MAVDFSLLEPSGFRTELEKLGVEVGTVAPTQTEKLWIDTADNTPELSTTLDPGVLVGDLVNVVSLSPPVLGRVDSGAYVAPGDIDTLAELNAIVADATLDDASATRTPTDGSVTGAKMQSGVQVWWFDAGANASAARPAGAAATDIVIWTNVPSVPVNLGARDQWEDAS